MLRIFAILAWLLVSFPATAQMLLTGLGHGSASGCSGAGCISFGVTGPSTGVVGVTSAAFTVTLSTGSFSGVQTITIADGAQGGTITPSVGSPGTSTVVVTPAAAATSFTFTYNPASTGTKTLTFTNAQGWTNAGPIGYISTRTFTASGPSTGTAGSASTNFTVTIGNGTFSGTDTITVSDGGQGGTFTPSVGSPSASSSTVTPTAASSSFTFTYNAAIGAPVTLTFTNAQGWINPVTLPYTGAVTYTASGPSTGAPSVPSTNFTVAMPASTHFTGSQTVTVADASNGGTFTPSVGSPGVSTVTVTPASNATGFTFTYNAASSGAKTLTFTNAQSWTNPTALTYTASGGGCAQATTFLARTSGLDGTHTAAYTTMICGMVTDGTWCGTNFDALWILATQSSTTALLNLCSTSFPLTVNGSPVFTADAGYTGTGVNSDFLSTGINPSLGGFNFTQNSAHLSVWRFTTGVTLAPGIGGYDGTVESDIYPFFTANTFYARINEGTPVNGGFVVTPGSGWFVGNRSGASAAQGYHNGTLAYSPNTTSSPPPNVLMYVLASNRQGIASADTALFSMASIGSSLTSGQVTSIYSRICSYLTTVHGSC